jgi:hypothetical protein
MASDVLTRLAGLRWHFTVMWRTELVAMAKKRKLHTQDIKNEEAESSDNNGIRLGSKITITHPPNTNNYKPY